MWTRAYTILALVPREKAPSDDSSSSDDEVMIIQKNYRERVLNEDETYCSSEPLSLPSSLENFEFSSDEENPFHSPNRNKPLLSDEETVPLTPVINNMFPPHIQPNALPTLNSVSSVLSPLVDSPAQKTRSKRKTITASKLKQKRPKKYTRVPLSFKWSTGKFKHTAIVEPFTFQGPSDHTKSPLDYFYAFFSEDIFDLITQQTNLYSVQSSDARNSINITKEDIQDFIAITLLMGIIQMPAYRDYWSNELRYPLIADVMPLKKYEQIRKHLHFVDNYEMDDDRYFKVRPLLEKVRLNCLQIEEEGRYSIDEMMIPYKGTRAGSRRQYLPKKPKKWGIKMFVRAGVSGMVYDFLPYGGDDTFRNHPFTEYENRLGLGATVVLALCRTIKKKPSIVYFDNFFTSLELIHLLRDSFGIFSLGTVRSNRLRGCQDNLPTDKVLAKKGRGASKQVVCNTNKLAVVKWYDNKAVTLASSYVDSHPMEAIQRYSKESKSRTTVDCPQIVKQYNVHMGGVDLADMLTALYRTPFKTKRWYMTIFSQVLDVCVNNAWLMHRRDLQESPKKTMPLKKFRVQVAIELLKKNRAKPMKSHDNQSEPVTIKTPVAPRPTEAVRYNNIGHMPVFVPYGRCKFCKNGYTNMSCSKCNLRLCLVKNRNCFTNFHNK